MRYEVAHIAMQFAESWQQDVFEQALFDLGFDTIDGVDAYIPSAEWALHKAEIEALCAETEGVTFCYEISQNSSGSSTGNSSGSAERVKAYTPTSVTVSVYAKKAGYFNSKTVTATFTGKFGDLNGDGEVNVADHVELSTLILGQ